MNNNIITSAVRTETEKRAYILFLMIATTYDLMPDIDEWLMPDDEDKEAAREMRAFIIKGNTIEFSYELLSHYRTSVLTCLLFFQENTTIHRL